MLLNGPAIRQFACDLADAIAKVLDRRERPFILGGDCSILLGSMLALRRRGRYGLLFLDGHADFYQPEAEPNGEAASMELAFATGRGPDVVTLIDGFRPLVREGDVVALGRRDGAEAEAAGSQRIEDTAIELIELAEVRISGIGASLERAMGVLTQPELAGFFVHLDCDVLDDALKPAVDYRLDGGLSWDELETVLAAASKAPGFAGIEVTIFNPSLDPSGVLAARLVRCLSSAVGDQQP